ncbi:hypothetical protein ACWDB3_31875 [Streptomyces bacillaris]
MTKRPTGDQLISGRPLPFSLETERPAWAVREELGEADHPALHATPPLPSSRLCGTPGNVRSCGGCSPHGSEHP